MTYQPHVLYQLAADYFSSGDEKLPPVHLWHPPLSGNIDICIDTEGRWWHEGVIVARQSLVRLFATILRKEVEDYFLVTPVEKWQIRVEREPFVIIKSDWLERDGIRCLYLTTNMGTTVRVDKTHPLEWHGDYPRVHVRDGLHAALSRSIYYSLVDHMEEQVTPAGPIMGIHSAECFFPLATL